MLIDLACLSVSMGPLYLLILNSSDAYGRQRDRKIERSSVHLIPEFLQEPGLNQLKAASSELKPAYALCHQPSPHFLGAFPTAHSQSCQMSVTRCGLGLLHPVLECLDFSPGCTPRSSFLFMCSLGNIRLCVKCLDPCQACERPRLNSGLLALASPSSSCCKHLGSQQADGVPSALCKI